METLEEWEDSGFEDILQISEISGALGEEPSGVPSVHEPRPFRPALIPGGCRPILAFHSAFSNRNSAFPFPLVKTVQMGREPAQDD
jgi:hypothetical protein